MKDRSVGEKPNQTSFLPELFPPKASPDLPDTSEEEAFFNSSVVVDQNTGQSQFLLGIVVPDDISGPIPDKPKKKQKTPPERSSRRYSGKSSYWSNPAARSAEARNLD